MQFHVLPQIPEKGRMGMDVGIHQPRHNQLPTEIQLLKRFLRNNHFIIRSDKSDNAIFYDDTSVWMEVVGFIDGEHHSMA
jgi:hypothetical protein